MTIRHGIPFNVNCTNLFNYCQIFISSLPRLPLHYPTLLISTQSSLLGKRNYQFAYKLLRNLSNKVVNRFQLSTNSFKPYKGAVRKVFANTIDYGQIDKCIRQRKRKKKGTVQPK